jgi:hypothetical protein
MGPCGQAHLRLLRGFGCQAGVAWCVGVSALCPAVMDTACKA